MCKLNKRQTKKALVNIIAKVRAYCPPNTCGNKVGVFPPYQDLEQEFARLLRRAPWGLREEGVFIVSVFVDGYGMEVDTFPERQYIDNVQLALPDGRTEIYQGFNPFCLPKPRRNQWK